MRVPSRCAAALVIAGAYPVIAQNREGNDCAAHDQLGAGALTRLTLSPEPVGFPDGLREPPASGRSLYTIYDNANTAGVYSYFPAGTVGVGRVPNAVVEGVRLGRPWFQGMPISQLGLCARRMTTTGGQTFKIFVRVWDIVDAQAAPEASVVRDQLPLGAPLDLLYSNGGAGYTLSGPYAAGYSLALPPGFEPTDDSIGIEVRLVLPTVETPADAANPANAHPAVSLDCFGTQSLLGGSFPPPGPPSVGAAYPSDGAAHLWVDLDDASAVPPRAHDGVYRPGDDLGDPRGATWANLYLRVFGEGSPNLGCAVFDAHPQDRAVCAGAPVTFSVQMSIAVLFPTLQWRRDGVPITGATGTTLTLPSPTAADSGLYDCVATSPICDPLVSRAATLLVAPAVPGIAQQPEDQSRFSGQTVTFHIVQTGTPAAMFQWRRNGENLFEGGRFQGVGSPSLMITGLIRSDAGTYDAVLTNPCGGVTSSTANLTVYCGGDWDHNGSADPVDIASYVNAWFVSLQTGTLDADDDQDGAVTPADVSRFVTDWHDSLVHDCH